MVRDRLDALAPHFERQGFHLSDKAVHNLGSCNRLIVLEGTYIELLGWPPGAPSARAKEIAVRRLGWKPWSSTAHDAEATERLRAAGFAVNPVQELQPSRCWTDVKSPRASIPCASPSSPCPASACISVVT